MAQMDRNSRSWTKRKIGQLLRLILSAAAGPQRNTLEEVVRLAPNIRKVENGIQEGGAVQDWLALAVLGPVLLWGPTKRSKMVAATRVEQLFQPVVEVQQ